MLTWLKRCNREHLEW